MPFFCRATVLKYTGNLSSRHLCARVAFAKADDHKNALVAADMLNDKVFSFYQQQDVELLRSLTDRGTEKNLICQIKK